MNVGERERKSPDSPRRDGPGSDVEPQWLTLPDGWHAPVF